jgi:hypothetical protein
MHPMRQCQAVDNFVKKMDDKTGLARMTPKTRGRDGFGFLKKSF